MKVRVVLVDDHDPLREMLTVMLRASGRFEVVAEASNGAEGVEAVARERPDLVIIDLDLGGVSGWDQLPLMKAAAPRCRIVVFSGASAVGTAAPEAALVDRFIEKGTSTGLIDHLIEAVADMLPADAPTDAGVAATAAPASARDADDSAHAAEIEAALRRFVRVAAHDLAQPLQVSYGYLELLRDQHGDDLPDDAGAWLGSAIRSLDRSRVFVREMLRYARVEAPSKSPHNLGAVARGARELLDPDLPEVDVRIPPDLPDIDLDGTQIGMVMEALLDNAIRHGRPEDARPAAVEVLATRTGAEWIVTVRDSGPGIPMDRRLKVVEPFERGQGVARPGLGLAIARLIVANHGGDLWIEDAPSGGASVQFTLPA